MHLAFIIFVGFIVLDPIDTYEVKFGFDAPCDFLCGFLVLRVVAGSFGVKMGSIQLHAALHDDQSSTLDFCLFLKASGGMSQLKVRETSMR